ncbi:MAG: hypothetical protein RL885_25130 [Planctomycetota bacterium]
MSRDTLFALAAETMVGTPYHHQGRVPGVGLDCVGLLLCAAQLVGAPIEPEREDERCYSRRIESDGLVRGLRRRFDQVPDCETIGPGSIVAMWKRRRGLAQHVGIVSASGVDLIHVDARAGVTRSSLDGLWGNRIVTTFRLR